MEEYTFKGGEPIPQKRPKKRMSGGLKALIVVLSLLIGIPALVVGVAAACFYDPSHKEVEINENATMESTFKSVLVDSLDNTPTTKKMDVKLVEKDLNTLLYISFGESLKDGKFIRNFYVDANSGTYDFTFEIDAYVVLKTNIKMRTSLTIVEEGDVDILQFDITDVVVGRIGGFLKLKNFIMKYIPTEDISNIFEGTGLHMKLDLENLRITYRSDDFYDDLVTLIGESMGGDTADFIQIFSEIMVQRTLRRLYYEDKTIFGIQVPIDNLKTSKATHGIDGLSISDGAFISQNINSTVTSKIKALLDNKKITEDANLAAIGYYYTGGYDCLDAGEKNYIDSLGSSVLGPNYKTIEPLYSYDLPEEKTIRYVVDEQTKAQVVEHYEWVRTVVSTECINDMLRHSKTMGSGTYFIRNIGSEETPNYKVNYVVLDNFTTIVNGDKIYIALNVDFNGYPGQMTLQCTKLDAEPTDEYGLMKLNIDSMYMGDLKVSKKTQDAFVEAITGSLDTNMFEVKNGVIQFSIGSLMESDGVPDFLYSLNFELQNNTASDEGAIIINAQFEGL